MKRIYTLLLVLLVSGLASAQNWTKVHDYTTVDPTSITGTYTPANAVPGFDDQETFYYNALEQKVCTMQPEKTFVGGEWANAMFCYAPESGLSGWSLLHATLVDAISSQAGLGAPQIASLSCASGVVTITSIAGSAKWLDIGRFLRTQGMPAGFSNGLFTVSAKSGQTGTHNNLYTSFSYNDALCVNGSGTPTGSTNIYINDELPNIPTRRHFTNLAFDGNRNAVYLSGGVADLDLDATNIIKGHAETVDLYKFTKTANAGANWEWAEVCGFGEAVAGTGVPAAHTTAGGPGQLCGTEKLTSTTTGPGVEGLPCTGVEFTSCGYKFIYGGFELTNDVYVMFGGNWQSAPRCETLLWYPATNTWRQFYNPSTCPTGGQWPTARITETGQRLISIGNGKLLLWSGSSNRTFYQDTWILTTCANTPAMTGCGWTKIATDAAHTPPITNGQPVMDYDSLISKVVLIDQQAPSHYWFFDPANTAAGWVDQGTGTGPLLPSFISAQGCTNGINCTVNSYNVGGAYDAHTNQMVVFNRCGTTTAPQCASTRTELWTLDLPATTSTIASPSSLIFGNVTVNQISPAQTVTLTNFNASSSVTISSIVASSGFNKDSTTCGGTLAASASCTVSVSFRPTSAVPYQGTLTFTDTAANSPQVVNLSGNGVAANTPTASLSPTSLTFASTTVGQSAATQSSTLTNGGNAPLTITSITITGSNPGDFSQTNNCGGSLSPGSCVITVTFTPTAAGVRTANVSVADNASGTPHLVSLSGTGASASITATLGPSSFTYPTTAQGSSSSTTLTLTNTSASQNLSITSILLGGTNPGDFSIVSTVPANNCGSSLAPSASCTINTNFVPTTTGARSATLTVTDNASPTTQATTLSGTGAAAGNLLTVGIVGPGSITSTSNPTQGTQISCPSTCSVNYPTTTSVTLTAIPQGSNTFSGWTGDCNGPSFTCVLSMSAGHSAVANFTAVAALSEIIKVQELLAGATGVVRTSEDVSVGLPIPDAAEIVGIGQLSLTGGPTNYTFRPLARWPDGNIKWVQVDYPLSLTAGGNDASVTLTNGSSGNQGTNMATDNGTTISVVTGTGANGCTFTIQKANFDILHSVVCNSKTIIANGTTGLQLMGPAAPLTGVNSTCTFGSNCTAAYTSANDALSSCVIEENGSVRVAVRCDGALKDASGNKYMGFRVRMHFFTGLQRVKVVTSLKNADDGQPGSFNVSYKGYQSFELKLSTNLSGTNNWYIADDSGTTCGSFNGASASAGCTNYTGTSAYIYQGYNTNLFDSQYDIDSPGASIGSVRDAMSDIPRFTNAPRTASTSYALNTVVTDPSKHIQQVTTAGTSGSSTPTWNDAGGTTTDGTVVWTDRGTTLYSQQGYNILSPASTVVKSGDKTHIPTGWADVQDSTGGQGIEIGMDYFATHFPASLQIASSGQEIRIGLSPDQSLFPAASCSTWASTDALCKKVYYQAYPVYKVNDVYLIFHDSDTNTYSETGTTRRTNSFKRMQHPLIARASATSAATSADIVSVYNNAAVFPYQLVDQTSEDHYMDCLANEYPAISAVGKDCTGQGGNHLAAYGDRASGDINNPLFATRWYQWSAGGGTNQGNYRWAELGHRWLPRGMTGRYQFIKFFERYLEERGWARGDCDASGANCGQWRWANHSPQSQMATQDGEPTNCSLTAACNGSSGMQPNNSSLAFVNFAHADNAGRRHLHAWETIYWYYMTGDEDAHDLLQDGVMQQWTAVDGNGQITLAPSQNRAWQDTGGNNTIPGVGAMGTSIKFASLFYQYLRDQQDSVDANYALSVLNNLTGIVTREACSTTGSGQSPSSSAGSIYPAGCHVTLSTASTPSGQETRGSQAFRGLFIGGADNVDSDRCYIGAANPLSTGNNIIGAPGAGRCKFPFMEAILVDGLETAAQVIGPTYQNILDLAYGSGLNMDMFSYVTGLKDANGVSLLSSPYNLRSDKMLVYTRAVDMPNSNVWFQCPSGCTSAGGPMVASRVDIAATGPPLSPLYDVVGRYTGDITSSRSHWESVFITAMQNNSYSPKEANNFGWFASMWTHELIAQLINPSAAKLQFIGSHSASGSDIGGLTTSFNSGTGQWTLNWTNPANTTSLLLKEHDNKTIVNNICWDPQTNQPSSTVASDCSGDPVNTRNWFAQGTDQPSYVPIAVPAQSVVVTAPATASFMLKAVAGGNPPPPTARLTLTVTGPGSVSTADGFITNCTTICTHDYAIGTLVTLNGTSNAGATLTSWAGCNANGNSCTINMQTNSSVVTTFTGSAATHTLTLTVTGPGKVSDNQGQITNCAATCTGTYNTSTVVVLTATPNVGGAIFSGWSQDCAGVSTCSLTLTSDRNATSTFTQPGTSSSKSVEIKINNGVTQ